MITHTTVKSVNMGCCLNLVLILNLVKKSVYVREVTTHDIVYWNNVCPSCQCACFIHSVFAIGFHRTNYRQESRLSQRECTSNVALSYGAEDISVCLTVYALITSVTDRQVDEQVTSTDIIAILSVTHDVNSLEGRHSALQKVNERGGRQEKR